jgi:transcriptional regulator with XRE-family HTH domain
MFGRRERTTPFQREPLSDLEDLRDDCIALFINSGMTQKQLHEAGGPTPQTISKWLYRETRFPRMDTIRSFLKALDYDIAPMPISRIEKYRQKTVAERLGFEESRVTMPRKHRRF